MASIVKTLTHKASRGRLRRQSQADADRQAVTGSAGSSSSPTPPLPPVPPMPAAVPIPSTPSSLASPSSNLSPSITTTGLSPVSAFSTSPVTPSTPSLRFWRRRDPQEDCSSSSSSSSASSRHRVARSPPKPILRRDGMEASPSPRPGSTVRFPGQHPAPRHSTDTNYSSPRTSERQLGASPSSSHTQTPPSAFRQAPATAPPNYALPAPPNRPPALHLNSAPSPTTAQRSGPSSASTKFNYAAHTPTFGPGSTSVIAQSSSAPSASSTSRASTYSNTSHRVSSYSTRSSGYRVSPPGSSKVLAATAAASGVQAPRPSSRQSTMHSSRPGSAASGTFPRGAAPAATAAPFRPSSVMSTAGLPRRRSSRPGTSNGNRTRASISITTFHPPSPSDGLSLSPAPISPVRSEGHQPTYPTKPLSPLLGDAFSMPPLSPSSLGRQAFSGIPTLATVPQSPDVNEPSTPRPRSDRFANREDSWAARCSELASPSLASTPGGPGGAPPSTFRNPRTPTPRRARSFAGPGTPPRRVQTPCRTATADGSPPPVLNLIPATPQDVIERPRSAPVEDGVEHEEHPQQRQPIARVLFEEWSKTSPRIEHIDFDTGSPIQLNVTRLDDLDYSLSSDSEDDDRTADAHNEPTPVVVETAIVQHPPPPPKPAKSPARKLQGRQKSFYEAHDDGRSISHSLAELAALACDLPSFGEELTLNAAAATERLAAARASVDNKSPATPQRIRRVPVPRDSPTTPPQFARAVLFSTPTTPPRQYAHDPVSPEFMSCGSLPSLTSHDSVPSTLSHVPESLESLSHIIQAPSSPSSPDAEEAISQMLHTLSESSTGAFSLGFAEYMSPATPKAAPPTLLPENPGLGLGLGHDDNIEDRVSAFTFASPGRSTAEHLESPNPKSTPIIMTSPASPPYRAHRMSAAAAHPHRAALYGTPSLYRRSVDSAMTMSSATLSTASFGLSPRESLRDPRDSLHMSHGSLSSLASDLSDDDVLNASIVAAVSGAYVVGRRNAHPHEVGVAF